MKITFLRAFSQLCLRFSVLLLLIALGTPLLTAANFQSWNEIDLAGSWKGVDFIAPLLVRFDSSLPNPQLAATGVTADIPLPWHITFTGGYLFAELPQRSLDVHLPLVAITPTFRVRRFTIGDRNRLEKLIGLGSSPLRYRNRLLLDRLFGTEERWHIFLGNEVVFNVSTGTWNQNRVQFGGGRRLSSRLLLDVYYLRRDLSGGVPVQNVLGTTLRITLNARRRPSLGNRS